MPGSSSRKRRGGSSAVQQQLSSRNGCENGRILGRRSYIDGQVSSESQKGTRCAIGKPLDDDIRFQLPSVHFKSPNCKMANARGFGNCGIEFRALRRWNERGVHTNPHPSTEIKFFFPTLFFCSCLTELFEKNIPVNRE